MDSSLQGTIIEDLIVKVDIFQMVEAIGVLHLNIQGTSRLRF